MRKILSKFKQFLFYKKNSISYWVTVLVKFRRNAFQNYKRLLKSYKIFCALKRKNKLEKYHVTLTGCIIYFTDNIVLKVPISNSAVHDIKNTYRVFVELKKLNYNDFIPYVIKEKENVLFMNRLQEISPESYRLSDITEKFVNYSDSTSKRELDEIYNLVISKLPQLKDIKHIIKNYTYDIGFMHGDLTPANIMQNQNGDLAIIDWDKYSAIGPTLYDKIHYFIEKETKEISAYNRYYSTLTRKIQNSSDKKELQDYAFYFLYRLSIEYKNVSTINSSHKEKLVEIINTLSAKNHQFLMTESSTPSN